MDTQRSGLCFRCEKRARFLEGGSQPRCECGDIKSSVFSCYAYRPVSPHAMESNEGDERPAFGPAMISARMHSSGVPEVAYTLAQTEKGLAVFAVPVGHRLVKADENDNGDD